MFLVSSADTFSAVSLTDAVVSTHTFSRRSHRRCRAGPFLAGRLSLEASLGSTDNEIKVLPASDLRLKFAFSPAFKRDLNLLMKLSISDCHCDFNFLK